MYSHIKTLSIGSATAKVGHKELCRLSFDFVDVRLQRLMQLSLWNGSWKNFQVNAIAWISWNLLRHLYSFKYEWKNKNLYKFYKSYLKLTQVLYLSTLSKYYFIWTFLYTGHTDKTVRSISFCFLFLFWLSLGTHFQFKSFLPTVFHTYSCKGTLASVKLSFNFFYKLNNGY